MKKLIILIAVMAFTNTILAQVSVGLAVGSNFSKIKSQSNVMRSSNSTYPRGSRVNPHKLGLEVGIPVEINLSTNFSIYTMLSFLQKGKKSSSIIPLNGHIQAAENTFNSNYIEVPLQAKYYLSKNKLNTYVTLGPSFGYLVGIKSNILYTIVTTSNNAIHNEQIITELSHSEVKDSRFNQLDISLTLGGGIEYEIGNGKMFFNANYLHGFSNNEKRHHQSTLPFKTSNRGLLTTVGYLMPMFN